LRFGSQAIGGVVETTDNRIPTSIPARGFGAEIRGAGTSVDNRLDGAVLLDGGGGNIALHADAFGRKADDYRVPSYPYLVPPDPATAPNATQPGAFNGRQPNSSLRNDGQAIGGSYIFNDGFIGLAVVHSDALYHIPGIDGEDHNTRIDAHQTKLLSKGEWRAPNSAIDAIRFWGGITDYKHKEIGLADDTNPASDGETSTPGYDDLRAEVSYSWRPRKSPPDGLSEATIGITGTNLLNRDIRNSVSYSKDEVLMPGASVRLFAALKY
jgi:iron complex outermembrane receptor protein